MGQSSRYQIHRKQRLKRKDSRKKLTVKGENLANYYYGKYYIK